MRLISTFLISFLGLVNSIGQNHYKIGAIFREKEDSHLIAALNYAIEWSNTLTEGQLKLEAVVKFVETGAYFTAVQQVCKMVAHDGISIVLGSSDPYMNEQLLNLTSQMSIPFINVIDDDWLGREHKDNSLINLFPNHPLLEALDDLIKHWKWTRVTVVFSDDARLLRLRHFFQRTTGPKVRLVKIHSEKFLDAAKMVESLEECNLVEQRRECSDISRILLDLEPKQTRQFLIAALQVGLIDMKHWFLLSTLDFKSMTTELFRHNHARFISLNIVQQSFVTKHNFNMLEFMELIRSSWNSKVDSSDRSNFRLSEAVLMFDAIVLSAGVLGGRPVALALDSPTPKCRSPSKPAIKMPTTLLNAMRNASLSGLSGDFRRIASADHQFTFRINLLGYNGILEEIGFWEPQSDVQVNLTGDSRAQLQNNNLQVSDELKPHFRVTTILERPYVMLKQNYYEIDEDQRLEGFCIDLLAELSRDLGFTYTIRLVRDKKYGNDLYGNGSWDGMIGEILRGETDLAVAPLTVNFRRAEVVDFTKPFLSLGISILFKIPADHRPDLFSFLNPLSGNIWICVTVAAAGITLGMFLISRLTPYEWNLNFSCCIAHQPHPGAHYEALDTIQLSNNYSFWNTLWYVMSTMLKGGCDFGPRAVSTRFLGATWWVFTLVITSAYTANLAAVLTVRKTYIPIKSIDDLANQTAIAYGTIHGGSTMQFFQESQISSHVKMWQYMRDRDVFVKNNERGVARVLEENYAYLMESSSLEYEVAQNCNLTQVGGVLGSKGYGSEWTDRISRQILLYAKRGIIELKKTKWWRSTGATCSSTAASVKASRISLNLYNIAGLFLVLIAGLLLAVAIVLGEMLARSWRMSKMDKNSFIRAIVQELSFALGLTTRIQCRTIVQAPSTEEERRNDNDQEEKIEVEGRQTTV